MRHLRNFDLKKFAAPLALIVLGAVVLAGCGSGNSSSNASTSASPAASKTAASASTAAGAVTTKSSKVGTILAGEGGKTLYLFEADKSGKPTCSGACAAAWPPAMATSSSPKASGQAQQSKLGTVAGVSGGKQLTYAGHPLYFFANDTSATDVNGNGVDAFGAEWYALTPAGANAEGTSSSSSSDSSSSKGYGGY